MTTESLPTVLSQTLQDHEGAVNCIRFNKKGTYCVSGGQDRMLRLWNPHSGLLVKTYSAHSKAIHSVDAASDNTLMTSAGEDKDVFLWDVQVGKVTRRFRGHVGRINCVRFNEENSAVVSGSYDATVHIFDVRANGATKAMQVLRHAKDSVTSLHISKHEIVAASVDGVVRTYDLRVGKLKEDKLSDPVTNVAMSHDRNCILASTLNHTIHLLDVASGDVLARYRGHKNGAYKVGAELLATDSHVAAGSEDGSLYLYELVEAKVAARIYGHKGIVTDISAHPDRRCFLSASTDGTIKVWSAPAEK